MRITIALLMLLPCLALASYEPALSCVESESSVHVEVCVPGLKGNTEEVERNIKTVVRGEEVCFSTPITVCEESVRTIENEVCVDNYVSQKQRLHAQTVQVQFEEKSETMKVTQCRPTGQQGYQKYQSKGEEQVCSQEYQTQQYQLPRVDIPLTVYVDVSVPVSEPSCQTVSTEVTETQCREELGEEQCVSLPELVDDVLTLEQSTPGLGYPKCTPITLALPIEKCSKAQKSYSG